MKIAIASDHAGFDLKEFLKEDALFAPHELWDLGTHSSHSVDYPDYAAKVAHAILDKQADIGILICGTGIGMSIAVNRFHGIRAALCHDGLSAKLSRFHNDANVVCIGANLIGKTTALEVIKEFLKTPFEGGRHISRIEKLDK